MHRDQHSDDASFATVLLVSSQPPFRAAAVEMLHKLGYRVLQADDGPTCLSLLHQILHGPGSVHLLILDPGAAGDVHGLQIAAAARELLENLPVLLLTHGRAPLHGLSPGVEALSQPFDLYRLAERVRTLLAKSPFVTAAQG